MTERLNVTLMFRFMHYSNLRGHMTSAVLIRVIGAPGDLLVLLSHGTQVGVYLVKFVATEIFYFFIFRTCSLLSSYVHGLFQPPNSNIVFFTRVVMLHKHKYVPI